VSRTPGESRETRKACPTGVATQNTWLASLTSCLYDRTGGSIGSLRALLGDAAIAAILEGAEKVDRKPLDTIPTDHAAEEFRTRHRSSKMERQHLSAGPNEAEPLPVPTRVSGGEGVVSYSHRHAARNHSRPGEFEIGVRERGIRLGRGFRAGAERRLAETWQTAPERVHDAQQDRQRSG
jgi:hypothetical protein